MTLNKTKSGSVNNHAVAETSKEIEVQANIRVLKYTKGTLIAMSVVMALNLLNIFIVDQTLMTIAFLLSIPCTLIPIAICKIYGINKKWIKYMLLTFTVLEVTVINSLLTYHGILVLMLPILYSSMYAKKKIMYQTYFFNLICMIASLYIGYFFGLCDANMLLLTTGPMSDYVTDGLPNFIAINDNPWLTVPLYYGLSRAIITFVLVLICISISEVIGQLAEHSVNMRKISEIDSMTGAYNKNKYLSTLDSNELDGIDVAVLFFDINKLKYVNDNFGHEYGDILIKKISASIMAILDSDSSAYRIGGDEFVVIMRSASLEYAQKKLSEWRSRLDIESEITRLPLSAAVGISAGNGSDIEELVKQADKLMYEDKCRIKAAENIIAK